MMMEYISCRKIPLQKGLFFSESSSFLDNLTTSVLVKFSRSVDYAEFVQIYESLRNLLIGL